MARTPSMTPQEAEELLGVPPFQWTEKGRRYYPNVDRATPSGQPLLVVTVENRGLVQKWLCARGVRSARAKGAGLDTLAQAYNVEAYLLAILARQAAAGEAFGEAADVEDTEGSEDSGQPEMPRPAPSPSIPDGISERDRRIQELLGLLGGGVSEARIVELIKEHAPKPPTVRITLVEGEVTRDLPEGVYHPAFEEVLRWAKAGVHVALVGPAGSGKSTIAEQVAAARGVPYYLSGAIFSEFQLTGFRNANGEYMRTAFRDAFEHGGEMVIEEMDASDPRILVWLNPALANGHADFPDGRVKMHADFHLIVCMNTYGTGATREYIGRNPLDAASLDRFAFVTINYDEVMERNLAGNDAWCHYVQRVRRAVDTLKIRAVVSPRASIYGARALANGIDRETVEARLIWKGLDAASVSKIKAAL